MAYTSTNPRYVFTKDRVPAVVTYSIATAIVSILGFLTYRMFERAGWLVDVKQHVSGASLIFDLIIFLIKLAICVAAAYYTTLFAKRALQGKFETPNLLARVNDKTFAITMSVMFLLGYVWKSWTEFNGVAGSTFFVVLAGIALSLLDIPFRKFAYKMVYLAVILIMFLIVMYSAASVDVAASSFSLLPSLLGLVSVAVLTAFVPWFAPYENQNSKFGSLGMIMIALFVFVGGTIWTVAFSFTSIKILPLFTPSEWWAKFSGFANYTRLFNTSRWMDCPALTKIGQPLWELKCSGSFPNVVTYAVFFIVIVMTLGFLIAVLMDQKIRAEGVFRTIYLYPFALSFIVTGHVWAWIFSPEYGLQKAVRAWGWEGFSFGWIADQKMVMYAIVIAGIWQGTGFVMALMLAGLRGIDEEIWKAAKIDGIPTWRTYLQIVLPMMKPVLVTTFVFVASGAIRIYDLVLAITDGGPGVSSDVPSRYIYQNFTANLGQSLAASTIMLLSMALVLIPWIRMEFGKKA
jgi:glucose/mannose transport system permease protein